MIRFEQRTRSTPTYSRTIVYAKAAAKRRNETMVVLCLPEYDWAYQTHSDWLQDTHGQPYVAIVAPDGTVTEV